MAAVVALGAVAAGAGVAYGQEGGSREAGGVQQAELIGRSVLPAETFRLGSAPSGFFTGITTPVPAPFAGQPVQGFSAGRTCTDAGRDVTVQPDAAAGRPAQPGQLQGLRRDGDLP